MVGSLGFRVHGSWSMVYGLRVGIEGFGFKSWGSGFRV